MRARGRSKRPSRRWPGYRYAHTPTYISMDLYTHTHIYIYVYIYICVCIYKGLTRYQYRYCMLTGKTQGSGGNRILRNIDCNMQGGGLRVNPNIVHRPISTPTLTPTPLPRAQRQRWQASCMLFGNSWLFGAPAGADCADTLSMMGTPNTEPVLLNAATWRDPSAFAQVCL